MKVKLASITTAILFLAGLSAVTAQEVFDPFQTQLDVFAGFSGDTARLQRAMENTEKEIKRNPNNGSALVWHGIGLTFGAQAEIQKDPQAALATLFKGIAEMERAVEVEPNNIGVRIPRG